MNEFPETEEVEEPEAFTLLEPPVRLDDAELPLSPRKTFRLALEAGWDARAWVSRGSVAPKLYVSATDEHSAGEVKSVGYEVTLYTVEAADRAVKLGFQATFIAKEYADQRKASKGSFESARIADPAGVPAPLSYKYPALKMTRGKFETDASFNTRVRAAEGQVARMRRAHNDGSVWYPTTRLFTQAKDLESWISEWKTYA